MLIYRPNSNLYNNLHKDNLLVVQHRGKSCVGMFSCVKVLCVTTTIKNITKKNLYNVT